jgi:acetyl esterase/lipase
VTSDAISQILADMKQLIHAVCFLAATLIPLPFSLRAADATGEPFVYKTVGGHELKLFITKPADWKATDERPAMVFFHGGGWVGGEPKQFNDHCTYFASRGLVTATVDYRLMSREKTATPDVCIRDAKSAMRWVRAHAKTLGIDPKRIGAGGGSAGGHLAAFVGMVDGKDDPQDDLAISPKANVMVLFNPVYNNGPDQYAYARVGEHFKEFSPAHNITPDDPPAIVFLGTKDHLIPVQTARDFEAGMKKAGVRCETHLYEGQKHGFYGKHNANGKYFYETVSAADKFLASLGWLKGEPTLAAPKEK